MADPSSTLKRFLGDTDSYLLLSYSPLGSSKGINKGLSYQLHPKAAYRAQKHLHSMYVESERRLSILRNLAIQLLNLSVPDPLKTNLPVSNVP